MKKIIKTFMTMIIMITVSFGSFNTLPINVYAADTAETVQIVSMYTYDEMCSDIAALQSQFPDSVTTGSIGTTALGRNIPYFTIGNTASGHNILIQSTVHAREYLATQVVMKMAEYYLTNRQDILQNVCFWIVPMGNPDGVDIAQFGTVHITDEATKNFVLQTGHTTEWKANAMGVDINRNFDIGWAQLTPRVNGRSYMNYKGDAAVTENETKALVAFASARQYDAFISYHMQGNVIYYDEPGNTAENSARSTQLAKAVANVNGYELRNLNKAVATNEVQQGGFTDWVQIVFNKPAITIEVGSSLPPQAQSSVSSIYNRNRDTWAVIASLYAPYTQS
ncbi:M14 family zinc carboxypeptidase [Butyrivibrio sp.]|uniref:M14 family zinc carboxypeptidase n=1 Tax=Butyrivibrio sp. TaxID=28121 RepID=UPI0025B8191E|nr:M14 family zinc carboxypeptidase [Butyrivibrio sp.]MBQ9303191.1 hypothetical protein [Butyrivibrio sp.]